MKQIVLFQKMHSNQEMVDYGNDCSQNKICFGWNRCARRSLNFLLGHLGWPKQTTVLVYTPFNSSLFGRVVQAGPPSFLNSSLFGRVAQAGPPPIIAACLVE